MSKSKLIYLILILTAVVVIIITALPSSAPDNAEKSNESMNIYPDYQGLVIPPNIAPLNFRTESKTSKIKVEFIAKDGYKFVVESKGKTIFIPIKKWKKMLEKSKGGEYKFSIFEKGERGKWVKYPEYTNKVSEENIDSHIAFRQIGAGYILWSKMGIYQRNIENFDQSPILLNERTSNNCMNCHSFCNNDPEKMMIHLRRPPSGTLLYDNKEIKFINTSTSSTMSAGVYPSWHPGGKHIAYSVNIIEQKFHSGKEGKIYVYDKASDIVVYDIEKNMITTTPALSTKSLENLPEWSPSGDYIYYINGPKYDQEAELQEVKYDLMGISFNVSTNKWGVPDTLLKAKDTGMSISFPKACPDRKSIVFCMSEYGYFTVHNQSSDLYIMDLVTKKYKKLELNSDNVESYHSWSSEGRWLQFISKKLDGLYSRVYFSYIDKDGKASKPFILPQEDPDYYSTLLVNFNRPEFIKGKVSVAASVLAEKAFEEAEKVKFDPAVKVDGLSGASRITKDVTTEHTN
ncbi:MAG: hypothetical protein KA807_04370 [Prolixibacteraceae bacterium]|nr:hypothetical protein [Prolixibacteraceae bacterium]